MVALRYLALSVHGVRHLAQMIGPAMEYRNATCFCPPCDRRPLLFRYIAGGRTGAGPAASGKASRREGRERTSSPVREGVCFSCRPRMMGAQPLQSVYQGRSRFRGAFGSLEDWLILLCVTAEDKRAAT